MEPWRLPRVAGSSYIRPASAGKQLALAERDSALENPRALLRQYRPGEIEALHLVAVVRPQELQLRLGLHALGDDPEIQAVAERDDRLGENAVLGAAAGDDVAHEGAVDLESADRQAV